MRDSGRVIYGDAVFLFWVYKSDEVVKDLGDLETYDDTMLWRAIVIS